jgi:hypothetical protein
MWTAHRKFGYHHVSGNPTQINKVPVGVELRRRRNLEKQCWR